MAGILFSIIAGVFISLQSVFNTRVSEKIGLLEATTVVHGVGFLFALFLLLFFGSGGFKRMGEVNKVYLLAGILGVIIVFSVMKGISLLGASFSVSIMLVSQLLVAMLIDAFGLFESPRIQLDFTKPLGVLIMIIGIIVFKLKG